MPTDVRRFPRAARRRRTLGIRTGAEEGSHRAARRGGVWPHRGEAGLLPREGPVEEAKLPRGPRPARPASSCASVLWARSATAYISDRRASVVTLPIDPLES